MLTQRREAMLIGPAEAARRLGISIKALRVYERRGLVKPRRTGRGWRLYAPQDLEQVAQALAFRAMGFSLSQIAGLMDAAPGDLAAALAAQEARLKAARADLDAALESVRQARRRTGAAGLRLVA